LISAWYAKDEVNLRSTLCDAESGRVPKSAFWFTATTVKVQRVSLAISVAVKAVSRPRPDASARGRHERDPVRLEPLHHLGEIEQAAG